MSSTDFAIATMYVMPCGVILALHCCMTVVKLFT